MGVDTVLIDIDGVLTTSWKPLPGAVDAIKRLRADGLSIALVTNTTSRTRSSIADTLIDAGFPITADDVLTAPAVTAAYLAQEHPGARCLLLNHGDIRADFGDIELVDDDPDVVVLGGAGVEFGYDALNTVFGHLCRGAALVAMSASMYWRTDEGLQLDTGAFLAGLQDAAGVRATVTGKPAAEFFTAALGRVGGKPESSLMIGDDLDSDVLAAQRCDITGVLVRTGKFRAETLDASEDKPDHVIDSIADLPGLLAES